MKEREHSLLYVTFGKFVAWVSVVIIIIIIIIIIIMMMMMMIIIIIINFVFRGRHLTV